MTENGENLRLIFFLAKRCNSELKQRRQLEVVFFSFLDGGFAQMFGQIFKTLRNTNLVASRCFKMKKTSLPVDLGRSKTPLLKLCIICFCHPLSLIES